MSVVTVGGLEGNPKHYKHCLKVGFGIKYL